MPHSSTSLKDGDNCQRNKHCSIQGLHLGGEQFPFDSKVISRNPEVQKWSAKTCLPLLESLLTWSWKPDAEGDLGILHPFCPLWGSTAFSLLERCSESSKQQAPHIFQGNRQFPEVCPSSFTEFIVQAVAWVTALASAAAFTDSLGPLPTKERGKLTEF